MCSSQGRHLLKPPTPQKGLLPHALLHGENKKASAVDLLAPGLEEMHFPGRAKWTLEAKWISAFCERPTGFCFTSSKFASLEATAHAYPFHLSRSSNMEGITSSIEQYKLVSPANVPNVLEVAIGHANVGVHSESLSIRLWMDGCIVGCSNYCSGVNRI